MVTSTSGVAVVDLWGDLNLGAPDLWGVDDLGYCGGLRQM